MMATVLLTCPFKQYRPSLPDNNSMALTRLQCTERKLKWSPELGEAYKEAFRPFERRDTSRKVPHEEVKPHQLWYLPHFPVLRPDKPATKTRIVFDTSAKFSDVSLNDIVLQGPKLLDYFAALLRFRDRRNPVALMCDIQEMCLQINPIQTGLFCIFSDREGEVFPPPPPPPPPP